uniref:Uncharacterized protein n=1 Tax=Sphaerodactylus townsendi TaxID=933632 RepID=A0ACB8EN88_9SAUR
MSGLPSGPVNPPPLRTGEAPPPRPGDSPPRDSDGLPIQLPIDPPSHQPFDPQTRTCNVEGVRGWGSEPGRARPAPAEEDGGDQGGRQLGHGREMRQEAIQDGRAMDFTQFGQWMAKHQAKLTRELAQIQQDTHVTLMKGVMQWQDAQSAALHDLTQRLGEIAGKGMVGPLGTG